MNRPGGVPQSLRGIPSGFNAQQQPPQQARSVSSRLPNGKLGNNGSGWAFGSGVPLSGGGAGAGAGGAALPNQSRPQQMGNNNISFAQSLGGSQPATPLDLSEFPSLSNTSQHPNAGGQSSLWSSAGTRNLSAGQPIQRNSNTPQQQQQQQGQHEDMFGSTTRLPSSQQQPGSFRFGNNQQGSIGQPAQSSQPGGIDDFPPLNRTAGAGEIGQDRGQNLMSSLGFGSQVGAPAVPSAQPGGGRVGNGLLNALSANSRASAEVRSPVGTRAQEVSSIGVEDDTRQKPPPFREEAGGPPPQPLIGDAVQPQTVADPRQQPLGSTGLDGASSKPEDADSRVAQPVQDPLPGMAPIDKWGMKGLRSLMSNYPDYSSMMSGFGLDLGTLGVDLGANELLSTQQYSLFDGVAPRPAIPKFRLPDCYKVTNVGPIENKITSFNEETLMWIFYSCPNDIKQQLAAIELSNRNWRWHKRQQVWLTKDDLMMPQVLSLNHERGYYIVWDTANWRKERTSREITLNYADLDNTPLPPGGAV